MEKGITLIEFLLVISIFVVVSSFGFLGVPRYYDYYHFSTEINELIDDLYFAKQMSIAEQKSYAIRFDYENNGYFIIKYGEEEEVIKSKNFLSEVEIINIEDYMEAKFTFFGAVFKKGKIKLTRESDGRIINIKPSGFIYVERIDIN